MEGARELDEKSLYNKINGKMRAIRFDSEASVNNDMSIIEIGSPIEKDNTLKIKLGWKYDDYKQNQVYYELVFPILSQQDIMDIRDKKSQEIYNKYKDSIIKKKYIY